MTPAPLLRLRGITRTFSVPGAPPLRILTGVDLDVHPGEHVAVVGRSGTGKSTLLNILGLIDVPTSGGYQLNGVDVAGLGESRRAHLRGQTFGFVFQSFNLIAGLTTTENVAAPLLYDHGAAFWRRGSRARELLEAVGLKDKAGMSIGRLSGGEQQRVAIAEISSPFTFPITNWSGVVLRLKIPEITKAKSANPITRIRNTVRFLIFSKTAIFLVLNFEF